MPHTISDFAAQFQGGVRSNLFRVNITGPEDFSNIEFLCKGVSIPASTIGTIAVPYRGRQLQVPGDRTFEPWTVTILNDPSWRFRAAFETWSNKITGHSANVSDLRGTAVYGTGTVLHLDRSGEVIRRYVMTDIFPTSIAAIELTSDANDAVEEYTVEFQVNGVYSKSTGGLDAGRQGLEVDVDLSVNAQVGPISIGLNI
jgi:hypothetical protein